METKEMNMKAEYYITIGKRAKHLGIATKASYAILNYAFSVPELHKVYLTVDSNNKPAIKLYEKVGFEKEGYFADDLFSVKTRLFIDRIRYAFLKEIL